MNLKRSQVEDAICRSHGARGTARRQLLVRAKRLLDIDRTMRPNRVGGRYAFFSERKPGTGQEVLFSEYEAFALYAALILAAHGVPHADLVQIFRHLRAELEAQHRAILSRPLDPGLDLGQAVRTKKAVVIEDPLFIALTQADAKPVPFSTKSGLTAEILFGNEGWLNFLESNKGQSITTLELAMIAQLLHTTLRETEPRRKGRPQKKT